MSSIALSGNASGAGVFTIASPNSASSYTITLPTITGGNFIVSDASGNVGIGTTAPSKKLEVFASANSLQIESVVRNDQSGSGVAAIGFNVSASAASETTSTKAGIGLVRTNSYGVGPLAFYVNSTTSVGDFTTADERMRIDSSGNLLVGKTTTSSATAGFVASATGMSATNTSAEAANFNRQSSDGTLIIMRRADTSVGTISVTASATAYNTSSDYRLKEDIAPMTGALAKVAALKPVTYKWKVDGSNGEGFIAHELAEVCAHAVSGEKDAVDADGNPQYQGVDVSFLVATLTAAIQEQQAIITSLTARIAALEGQTP